MTPDAWIAVASVIGAGAGVASAMKKPPKPKDTPIMPTEDVDSVLQARRKQAEAQQVQTGRASTILSQGDRLGG